MSSNTKVNMLLEEDTAIMQVVCWYQQQYYKLQEDLTAKRPVKNIPNRKKLLVNWNWI